MTRSGRSWLTKLPATTIIGTPNGGKLIFYSTEEKFGPAVFYRGIRVISDGYVIVPPSPGWEAVDNAPIVQMPKGLESALKRQVIPCRPLGAFLEHDFPPVKTILGRWMLERGSVMLCGRAGLGKTWSSLGIAIACAAGTPFLDWQPQGNRKRVLYIDGEMPAEKMQERYRLMLAALTPVQRALALGNIHIISHVDAAAGIPSLGDGTSGGRELVEAWAEDCGAEILVLDNLSALATVAGKSESDDTCWQDIRDWIGRLMRRGHMVLIIHHSGKPNPLTGETTQRGTSKREDGLDSSIMLSRRGQEGPVTWTFTKNRHNDGSDPTSFTIELDGNCWFQRAEPGEPEVDPREERLIEAKRRQPELSKRAAVAMFKADWPELNESKVWRIWKKAGLVGKEESNGSAGSEETVHEAA